MSNVQTKINCTCNYTITYQLSHTIGGIASHILVSICEQKIQTGCQNWGYLFLQSSVQKCVQFSSNLVHFILHFVSCLYCFTFASGVKLVSYNIL